MQASLSALSSTNGEHSDFFSILFVFFLSSTDTQSEKRCYLRYRHADLAADEETKTGRKGPVWVGPHGRCARILADCAHKAVDMQASGYIHDLNDLESWVSRCTVPIWHGDEPTSRLEDVQKFVETGGIRDKPESPAQKLNLRKVKQTEYCLTKHKERVYIHSYPRSIDEAGLRRAFHQRWNSVYSASIWSQNKNKEGGSWRRSGVVSTVCFTFSTNGRRAL